MKDVFSDVRFEQKINLEPKRSAILVIDMLNDFCKPGGKMVLPGYEKLIPQQRLLINAAREVGVPVFWILHSHDSRLRRDRELLKRGPSCILGTWGGQIIDDLEPREEDFHIYKHRYSGFYETALDLYLKDMQCDQLIMFGVVTNICVRSTAHDAFFRGYEVVVPEDCSAATGPREQASTLYDIATHFGVVSTAQEVAHHLVEGGTALQTDPRIVTL